MIRKTNVCNQSNYFIKTDTVASDLSAVIGNTDNGIFGLEIMKSPGVVSRWLVTPPFLRVRPGGIMSRMTFLDGYTFYEGYLSGPYFLPLYRALHGECLADMERIELAEDERICIQWLFQRTRIDRNKTMDMYESYLLGNGVPVASAIVRSLQENVLTVLNKLSNTDTNRDYSMDVEDKIASESYRFQLRVAIKSDHQKEIKGAINDILERYTDQNSLKLYKMKEKGMAEKFQLCIMDRDRKNQIFSIEEINSLLGINVSSSPAPAQQVITAVPSEISKLLPFYRREATEISPTLVTDLSAALKRVGLINTARIHNESIQAGVRLTVVQCAIPKGKNLSHLSKAKEDIQAALGVQSLGVEQGTEADTVRFTIPNTKSSMICLRELVEAESFKQYSEEHELAFVVGVDEINNPIYLSLVKLVHLLIAGTTGSGKSVFLNSIVLTLIMQYGPDRLQFLMVDPKLVELQHFARFPHVRDVITDMSTAEAELKKVVAEMESRYALFNEAGVKNITLYNKKMDQKMPYLVCVIDEYADLFDQHKEVADHIKRLGQKARAAGIHLIIATQRPDAKILEGRIKSNIPNAISFNLSNNRNYSVVFGTGIPYSQLLGQGDGVMKIEGYPKQFQRFQSPIICPDETKEEEVYESIIDYYGGTEVAPQTEEDDDEEVEEIEEVEVAEEDHLYQLKQIIATTRETKVGPLREQLGVQTIKMKELMTKLVEEGWLIKHKDKVKGYEIIAPESILEEWKK